MQVHFNVAPEYRLSAFPLRWHAPFENLKWHLLERELPILWRLNLGEGSLGKESPPSRVGSPPWRRWRCNVRLHGNDLLCLITAAWLANDWFWEWTAAWPLAIEWLPIQEWIAPWPLTPEWPLQPCTQPWTAAWPSLIRELKYWKSVFLRILRY